MSSQGPRMDVKVLYTLDSSPNHTMVARLGHPIPVEVIIPNMTPPSPLGSSGSNYHQSPPQRQIRFGRIALKTCLGAVCMASPELLPDDKRDYIIYAVDPEETLRANQARSSPTRSSSSTSTRNDASSSKLSSSPSRPKDAPSSILVGKGFFNWALDEQGEGETTVTGRVRSDGRRLRYENGREFEEDINVLEVVIKLKESQTRSKDKYFNLVRGLSSGASSFAARAGSSSSHPASRDVEPAPFTHRIRTSRLADNDSNLSLHSEPDYPTSSSFYGTMERQIHRPVACASPRPVTQTDRVVSPKTATVPLGASPSLPNHSTFPTATSPAPAAASPTPALSIAASNPSTLQLLTILHSLQQRSSKSAPEPAQQAQLETLLQQVAQALATLPAPDAPQTTENTASNLSSASPALSTRPLDPIPVPNARSPLPASVSAPVLSGKENRKLSLSAQPSSKASPQIGLTDSRRQSASSPAFDDEDVSSPSVQRRDTNEGPDRICYNCGTDVPTTWRLLKLPAGSIINNPAAEKSANGEGNGDDSTEPGWKPLYAGRNGPIETDSETRWSACNPCGLYYLKWNNSRPEYVWKKEHATKAYRERKALAEAAKRRRETLESGSNKRARIANSDIDAASPYSISTPRDAGIVGRRSSHYENGASDESMTSPNFDASTPGSSSARKASMPRTLSEACHRDAEKLESQRSSKKKDKEKPMCKKQADREYVLDPSTGKWRSRRSMRENPEGKRPGRPKGSVKVPQHQKQAAKSSPAKKDDNSFATAQHHKPDSNSTSSKQVNANSKSVPASKQQPSQQSSHSQPASHDEFRAPLPPQLSRQASSRMTNFAQSSPVRPSMNASLMQPDAVNSLPSFASGMLKSPSRDVRFRVPTYLMNSSPGTMLDTLMSEADFDFEEVGPIGPLQTPGTLLGNISRNDTRTPLRRSPRKNPHSTVSGQNPYASPSSKRSCGSPSLGRDSRMGNARLDLNRSHSRRSAAPSSSDSPVTRSRTRSGQDVLHPALYSSSDEPSNANAKSSSNATSPASPSEKGSKTKSSVHNTGKAQISSQHSKVEFSASRRRSADINGDDDEDNDGPEATFVKGPYRSASREGSAGLPSCPASPSLGRATRKFGRNLSSKSVQNGPARLAQLDLPPSSPVFDHPTNGSGVEVDGWGRTPSMREIFPTPSDLDWPSDASPSASQSPSKEVEKTEGKEPAKKAPSAPTTQAVVRRRPLPATVEDGSSSVSGSSPALSEESPENSNLFDLLEDPYGILAASGFGIDADGALTSLEIPVNPNPARAETSMTPTSSAAAAPANPSISADNFTEISLHQAKEFGTHLSDFNQSGGVGIAAHVAPDRGSAAAVQIADSSSGTGAGMGMDPSFLANLPPELSNILTSPNKPKLTPQIIEILASPRKNKATGDMVVSPQTNPNAAAGGAGVGEHEEEHEFSALFANPDIQALLAQFEANG